MRVTLLRFTETDEWCVRNTKFLRVLRSLGSGNNQLSRAHLDQLRGRGRSTNCARSLHVCLTPNSIPPGYPFAPGVVELDRPPPCINVVHTWIGRTRSFSSSSLSARDMGLRGLWGRPLL